MGVMEDWPVASKLALVALGAAAPNIIGWADSLRKFLWRQFLRRPKDLSSFGEWAIVTGATDGIGRAYCERFAEQGLNLLLVSRSEEKLATVAAELEGQHHVQCKYHAIDLVKAAAFSTHEQIWTDLRGVISSLDVGLLVNNAAMCYSYPERLKDLDTPTLHGIPAINNASLVKMTQLVLPGMTERRRGIVINLSTVGAARIREGAPFISLYAASKAFVESFSAGLAEECKPDGIQVQVHSPAFVQTKMFVQPNNALSFSVTPGKYSEQSVKHIGYENFSVPCAGHAIARALLLAIPRSLYVASCWSRCRDLREQALREMQAGSRERTGTLATAEGMSPADEEALLRMTF
eukprot:jgi/Ulvmu1/12693/UM094_0051.1